jgi:hypothetical protein
MHDVIMVIHFYLAGRLYWLPGISALKLGEKCNMDILARFVDKEEKILVKLIIVSAHVLERISQVANTTCPSNQVLDKMKLSLQ